MIIVDIICSILIAMTLVITVVGIIEIYKEAVNPCPRMLERPSPRFKDVPKVKTQSVFNEVIR